MTNRDRLRNCGAWVAVNSLADGTRVAVPLTCRSWDCPDCRHYLKRRLLRRLQTTQPNLFITLTTSERTAPTPALAFPYASQMIGALIKRWRRKFPGQSVEYFLVWERTKKGWPHAHVLLKAPVVSKHWLSHTWQELTRSYVVDLQKVSSVSHAATYLAKYLGKDPEAPPGFRRYRRSAGFFSTKEEPHPSKLPVTGPWTRQPYSATTQALLWLREGYALVMDDRTVIYASHDPDEHARQIASGLYDRLIRQSAAYGLDASNYS